MRNLDLDSLQVFKAVVDCGSVTGAAAQLHRVPSNVSTRIKNLEERLGVQLFLREGGKLSPSSEGRLLLAYAQRLLQLSSEAESALRSGMPRGVLRIGTVESTAAARLPPLLSRYHRDFPEVQIELVSGTSGAMLGRLRSFDIEAAFVSVRGTPAGLGFQHAFVEELVLISAKACPVSRLPEALGRCTMIAFSAGCTYRSILEEWLGKVAVTPERVLELGSYHAIVACVAAGAGVAIVPRSVLEVVRACEDVAVTALPPEVARSETALVWRSGHSSVALAALQAELARPPQAVRASGRARAKA